MNDEILKLATKHFSDMHNALTFGQTVAVTPTELEAFYRAAFNAGRSAAIAEMEKAEPVAWRANVDGLWFTAGSRKTLHVELVKAGVDAFIEPLYDHPAPAVPEGEK